MYNSDSRIGIGKRVRSERLKHGWTQEELAERTDIHPSFVGQMERGLKAASLGTLKRLSSVFGIKTSELLGESTPAESGRAPHPVARRILSLLKGCTAREQEAVYQTIKYILRKKRNLSR